MWEEYLHEMAHYKDQIVHPNPETQRELMGTDGPFSAYTLDLNNRYKYALDSDLINVTIYPPKQEHQRNYLRNCCCLLLLHFRSL